MASAIFLACLGSTLFMVGLIWFVHVVHYPLFDGVPLDSFLGYHRRHTGRTTYVVAGPMLLELVTSGLLIAVRPAGIDGRLAWAGFAAAGLTWASTALVQVPLHGRLASGFDPTLHRRLVGSNSARVVLWTAHGLLMLAMAAQTLD